MTNKKFIWHKIVVIVPFRNVGEFIIDCVNSIANQYYENYEIVLLDDASTDNCMDLISEDLEYIHRYRNEKQMGAMENIFRGLTKVSLKDDDIIVIVDGDDFIFGEYAFQIVNEMYNSNILLTYGQFVDNYGRVNNQGAYSISDFENLRNAPWKASHLKTFKYKLFKEFLKQDPKAENFKYENGQFYGATYDQALMFPLMEIAGYENIAMIPNIVYCYRLHPNNDHATAAGKELQIKSEYHIRRRKPLKQAF